MVDINGVCKTITNLSRGITQLAIKLLECFLHRGEWWREIDNCGGRRGSCCVVVESPEDRNKIKAEQTRRRAQKPLWGRVNFDYSFLR
jgi:hypothetical protein